MKDSEFNIYQDMIEMLKAKAQQLQNHEIDPARRERVKKSEHFKVYDLLANRIVANQQSKKNELAEAMEFAKELKPVGVNTSMFDNEQRPIEENLRIFMIDLKTKSFKVLSEKLTLADRELQKVNEASQVSKVKAAPTQDIFKLLDRISAVIHRLSIKDMMVVNKSNTKMGVYSSEFEDGEEPQEWRKIKAHIGKIHRQCGV